MRKNLRQMAAGLLAAAMLAAALPLGAFAEETAAQAPADVVQATAETAADLTAETALPDAEPASTNEESDVMTLGEGSSESYIIFDFHDGGGDPKTVSAAEIAEMTALPTRTHTMNERYVFAGWYTKPDGEGEQLTLEKAKANEGQITVYAKWTTDASGTRTVRTEPLDCTDTESVKTDMENAAQGWAWNKATKTLTLDGASFCVQDGSFNDPTSLEAYPAITVPDGTTIAVKADTASWVCAAAEAIYVAGSATVQGGETGALVLEGGTFLMNAYTGLYVCKDLTVDGILLSVDSNDVGVYAGGALNLKNGAVVSAFGENTGVQSDANITVTDSRLIGGIKAALEPAPEPDIEPQPEPEEEETGIGIYAGGTLTVRNNGEVSSYGDKYAIAAEQGILVPVNTELSEVGTAGHFERDEKGKLKPIQDEDGFVSGKTQWIKQAAAKTPAVLRQESRSLYYYPEDGKLYYGLKSEGAREVIGLPGWSAEKNGDTYDLLLDDFEYTTTADTALNIVGNGILRLSGKNSLDALALDANVRGSIALAAWYDLTIVNNNDPSATLQITAWDVDGSSVIDPDVFIGTNAMNVGGKLTATDVALEVISGDAIGPKFDGAEAESTGIACSGDITMTNVNLTIATGDVTDNGDNGLGCTSRGIDTLGSLTLNNCQTVIELGKAGRSEGIFCNDEENPGSENAPQTLTVNGGKLTAYANSATLHSVGLAFYNIKAEGGADVKIFAGDARDLSHGVFTRNLTVDNATLYAYGSMGGIRVGNSCTLTGVTAKGAATDVGEPTQAAEWKKAPATSRGSVFTLVGSGETCTEVLINATAPAPTATPTPTATAAPTATPAVVPTAAPAAADNTAASFTVNAWVTTGGTVSPIGVTIYARGANATYTITPAAGYRIVKVVVDGVDVGAVSSYTFSAMNRNHEIGVYFDTTTAAVTRSTIPQTGDEAPLQLLVVLMAAAALGLAASTVLRRRKSAK